MFCELLSQATSEDQEPYLKLSLRVLTWNNIEETLHSTEHH